MKRLATFLPFFFLFIAPQTIFARGEHLEPTRHYDSSNHSIRAYYAKVFSLLYAGFSSTLLARCTVLPSFSAEYAWSIERRSDGLHLRTNALATNLWYAKDKNVAVVSREVPLEPELAEAAVALFQAAGAEIRAPIEDGFGCDGVTWTLLIDDGNGTLREGETWSPPKGSLMLRLTEVCDSLFALPEGKGPSQAELAATVRVLTADIRAQAVVFPWLGNGVRGLMERLFPKVRPY